MAELIIVKTYFHKHEAQMALGLLNSNGIEGLLSSDDCGGYRDHLTLGMGNHRLLVKPQDLNEAQTILEAFAQPLSEEELKKIEQEAVGENPLPTKKKKNIIAILALSIIILILSVGYIQHRHVSTVFDPRDCRSTGKGVQCREYYKSGQIKILEEFQDQTAVMYEYYPNGALKSDFRFVNKKLEGPSHDYNENGRLEREVIYKNNLAEGEEKTYYSNGQIRIITPFQKDQPDGEQIIYAPNGNVIDQLSYRNGVLFDADGKPYNGTRQIYFENKTLMSEWNFKNGLLDGPSKEYTEDGILKEQANYNNGGLDSTTVEYFPNGTIQRRLTAKDNFLASLIEYDPAGNIIFEKSWK